MCQPHESSTPGVVLADIGGTHARFALLGRGPRDLRHLRVYRCSEFGTLEEVLDRYLASLGAFSIQGACLAVPGPIDQDPLILPNNPWQVSRERLEGALRAPVTLMNDFMAQGFATEALLPHEVRFSQAVIPDRSGVRLVLGPGTGLGMAIRPSPGRVMPSEGGHSGFSPSTMHELEVMQVLLRRFRRVSVERVLSGPGLVNLYLANRELLGGPPAFLDASEPRDAARGEEPDGVPDPGIVPEKVSEAAARGEPLAVRAVQDFFDILASFAGDMALTVWAAGGVYITGDLVQKLSPFLDEERFRARFAAKGRLGDFCTSVAIGWVDAPEPGLLGCAVRMWDGVSEGISSPGPT